MTTGRDRPRPTPAQEAQIRAVLALDVDREDELIRERALEIAADCEHGDVERQEPALDLELRRLVDAFEGHAPAPESRRRRARTAAEVGRDSRELVARIDASRGRA